jgi:uncharacterized protein (DUF2147 family)
MAQEQYVPGVMGVWLSENKKQKVRVTYDEKKKMYFGQIIWMYEDDQENGRKLLDINNPNPKLRTRRVTGINLMHSFKHEGNGVFRGYVYDPISGKEYRCLMTLQPDKKTAHIRGYILIPWIGRTEIATKISD